MKIISRISLVVSVLVTVAYGANHRNLRKGSDAPDSVSDLNGAPKEPDTQLKCDQAIPCDLKVYSSRKDPVTIVPNGGIRICRMDPVDGERPMCISKDAPIMGYSTDTCGCCGGTCPQPCGTQCPCEQLGFDGTSVAYQGVSVQFTRPGFSGTNYTVTSCYKQEDSVAAQEKGGVCVTSCP